MHAGSQINNLSLNGANNIINLQENSIILRHQIKGTNNKICDLINDKFQSNSENKIEKKALNETIFQKDQVINELINENEILNEKIIKSNMKMNDFRNANESLDQKIIKMNLKINDFRNENKKLS
jgi:hypothetical protein